MAALVVVLGIFMCKLNVVRVGQGGCGSKANFRSGRCQQRDRPARSEPFWVQACTATSKGVCASCWAVRWRAEEVSVGQGRGRARSNAADGRTGTCGAWLEPSLRVPDGEAALLHIVAVQISDSPPDSLCGVPEMRTSYATARASHRASRRASAAGF